jgi:hypothetical protein
MDRSRQALAVHREHVWVPVTRTVVDVFAVHHPREPRIPIFQRQEVLLVGRLVPLGVDAENPVHPHIDVPVGLVVTVVEMRPRHIRGNGVGVLLAGVDLDSRRRRHAVVLPSLLNAVEVERVWLLSVCVIEGDLHILTLGRPQDRTGDARLPVVSLERPDTREFDRPTHRVERVNRVFRGHRRQRHRVALLVDVDDLGRTRRGKRSIHLSGGRSFHRTVGRCRTASQREHAGPTGCSQKFAA